MRKCVVVPDSFKGSVSSVEHCAIVAGAVEKFFPGCEVVSVPVADGGEGTVDCFLRVMEGQRVTTRVSGPYFEAHDGFYGKFGKLAVIEMAAAAGLPMVGNRKNPLETSTYGVGELIRHALVNGAKEIILGMGGSCTNDGGCGCAAALGTRFFDRDGKTFVPTGGTLGDIAGIDAGETALLLSGIKITAMCDVENPLHGPMGAAVAYGPQKGADAAMVDILDCNLRKLDHAFQAYLGLADIARMPGAGAAGGMGAGVAAFLGGELKSGIEAVLDITGFDAHLAGADAVFTGEGRIDAQSLKGKVVVGVARRAKKQGVPVYAVVGDVEDDAYGVYEEGVSAIFSINRKALPFSEARKYSERHLANTVEDILRLIRTVVRR